MSKFKPGQKVICIDTEFSDLDLYRCYTVKQVDLYTEAEADEVLLEEEKLSWLESRFEDADVWASHQKACDVEI